jgi:hypothetical protein
MFTARSVLVALILLAHAGAGRADAPAHSWSQRFGGASTDGGQSVAVDGSGHVIVTGFFQGTADFGGGGLTSAGGQDVFLARYTPAGAHVWSRRFGATSTDRGHAVAVDDDGNITITGCIQGTVDFGGGGITGGGNNDAFIACFDSSGTHRWSRAFGAGLADEGLSVAGRPDGGAVMIGYSVGTSDFGGGSLTGLGVSDIVLAAYDTTGTHLWSRRFGDTSSDHGNDVCVDASGNVFITGYFNGTVNFGTGPLTTAGIDDIFLAKFNAAGVNQWSRRFGGTGLDDGYGVAVSPAGNVLVTGFFQDAVTFGGTTLTSAGLNDAFLVACDANGFPAWSRRFGSTSGDEGRAVAVDALGRVTVTGFARGTVDFGGGALTAAGNNDMFLAQFDAAGAPRWSRLGGGTGADTGEMVAVGGSGRVVTTGQFQGSGDFGGGTLTGTGLDIFLACYGADLPTAVREARAAAPSINAFPNPFNPRTTIRFSIPARGRVTVTVHDARGARVATLVDRADRRAGAHAVEWNGRADTGTAVSSGVYFARVSFDGATRAAKLVLLK